MLDFIGRFENLPEDAAKLGTKLGVSMDLPHLNRTSRRNYQEYYDAAAKRAAEPLVKDDLNYFNYQF